MDGRPLHRPVKSPTPPKDLETDPRFPSGKWTGFWLQRHFLGRQWMGLQLEFHYGRVIGGGADCVGDFTMGGTYDVKTGNCSIVKTYDGAHSLIYEGRNEGDGLWLWGLWRMTIDRGGFHLWPAYEDDPTLPKLRAARERTLDTPVIKLPPVEVPASV